MKLRFLALLIAALALAAMPAGAAVVYDSGAISGNISGFGISSSFSVSNSFTLTSPAMVTGLDFGIWLRSGVLTSVDWAIGDVAFGNSQGSGTATVDSAFQFTNVHSFNIYSAAISLPSLSLGVGTYWLTLSKALSSEFYMTYWDANNSTLSTAWINDGTAAAPLNDWYGAGTGSYAESFRLTGAETVPEPATMTLIGGAILGLSVLRLRRRAR